MSLCMQDSTQVQHKFEQAVWEVSFVLQKSADDPASGGARQKEYVARIRQALKNLIAVADEASEKEVTLRWKNNPIFEWQSHLESSKWIPAYLASQCKANFAWFVVNVETSAGKGSATRPPGMGKLGVKEEEPIQVDDTVSVKLEDAGPEEKEKKTRTPVKPVMSIKKPLIITSIGPQKPPATPLFNAKLHVRNDPKCHQCRPRPRVPNGYDCFRKKVASHPASSCFRCILNHTKCTKEPADEVQFVPSDDEPPKKKRKTAGSPNSESEQEKRPKRNARANTTRESAPSPPESADEEQ